MTSIEIANSFTEDTVEDDLVEEDEDDDDDDDVEVLDIKVNRVFRCKICQEIYAGAFDFQRHFIREHRGKEIQANPKPFTTTVTQVPPPASPPAELEAHGEGHDNNEKQGTTSSKEGPLNVEHSNNSSEVEQKSSEEDGEGSGMDVQANDGPPNSSSASVEQSVPVPGMLQYLGLREVPVEEDSVLEDEPVIIHSEYHCINCPFKCLALDSLKAHAIKEHILSTALTEASSRRVRRQTKKGRGRKSKKRYCVCKKVSRGDMIACDNRRCKMEWFHFDCVGIVSPPEGKWYCPSCR